MTRKYGAFSCADPGLILGSNPIPCSEYLSPESAAKGKRLLCTRYVNCLTVAASRGYRGFSCNECNVREEVSRDQQKLDAEGFVDLLQALDIRGGTGIRR